MGLKIRSHFALTLLASSISLSCASTQLSNNWRDASYSTGPLKKILVVAVRKDQLKRRAWENCFAAGLSRHDVDATPSFSLIDGTLPDMGLIDSVAKDRHFDGILLVGRASTKTTESVTPSLNLNSTVFPPEQWGESYYEYYDRGYYPGYPIINEIVKAEIKMRITKGEGRTIWSGVGEVHESVQGEDAIGEIISLVVKELAKQGVIAEGS